MESRVTIIKPITLYHYLVLSFSTHDYFESVVRFITVSIVYIIKPCQRIVLASMATIMD